jgi:transcriptional regulator
LYIPEHFRVRHDEDAVAFMQANPFAILVSSSADGPFATHAPLVVKRALPEIVLRGHVAKANPHWQYLERQPECLTIFHGSHAYISPSNYATAENVPTWNYGAVHAYGTAKVLASPQELLPILHQLIATFEASYRQQWAELSESYRQRMLSHIVGFEITVTRLEAKFKLSQNRTRQEQANVIQSLGASADTAISGVARLMRQQGLGNRAGAEKGKPQG